MHCNVHYTYAPISMAAMMILFQAAISRSKIFSNANRLSWGPSRGAGLFFFYRQAGRDTGLVKKTISAQSVLSRDIYQCISYYDPNQLDTLQSVSQTELLKTLTHGEFVVQKRKETFQDSKICQDDGCADEKRYHAIVDEWRPEEPIFPTEPAIAAGSEFENVHHHEDYNLNYPSLSEIADIPGFSFACLPHDPKHRRSLTSSSTLTDSSYDLSNSSIVSFELESIPAHNVWLTGSHQEENDPDWQDMRDFWQRPGESMDGKAM